LENHKLARNTLPAVFAGFCFATLAAVAPGVHAQAGQAWGWGYNFDGELGDTTNRSRTSPIAPTRIGSVVQVSGGWDHTLVLNTSGVIYSWGANGSGQLGDATQVNKSLRVKVPGTSGFIQVSAGRTYSLALKGDGTVYSWGYNVDGELGNGTNLMSTSPQQIAGLSNICQVSAGIAHALALRTDGTVWAWGDDAFGELGDGATTSRNTPQQVPGLAGVVRVVAGGYFSLALKSDGSLWVWGADDVGQLGDGGGTVTGLPQQLAGFDSAVVSVAAGLKHAAAVTASGAVYTWGSNARGQIGDGTNNNALKPLVVPGVSGIQVAAGIGHTLLLQPGGTALAWGRNDAGQLGDGDTNDTNAPVAVAGLANQTQISAGGIHSLSVQSPALIVKTKPATFSVYYGGVVNFKAKVKDSLGASLAGTPVTFAVDGATVGTAVTGLDGSVTLGMGYTTAFLPGPHAVTASTSGDLSHQPSSGSSTLTICAADLTISVANISAAPGQTKTLTTWLKRRSDRGVVVGSTVNFRIDGALIGSAVTDGTGKATLPWTADDATLSIGAHQIWIEFLGDALNEDSDGYGILSIYQAATKTSPVGTSGKVGATIPIKIKLARSTDKAGLAGQTVDFQIDGVDLGTAVTDATGTATLNYTIPVGTVKGSHAFTASFAGATYYLSSSGSTTLTVR